MPNVKSKKPNIVLSVKDHDLNTQEDHIINPEMGLHLVVFENSTVLIPPKMKCLMSTGLLCNKSTSDGICNAIDALSGKVKNSLKRGIAEHICSDRKYICVGTWRPRGSTEIMKQHYSIENMHPIFWVTIQKYVSGVEHCFLEYGERIELKMLKEATELIGPSMLSVPKNQAQQK